MKNNLMIILTVAFIVIIITIAFLMTKCIAESDMDPWLKAWLLFGGKR